jgi:hypothetical protein
MMATATKKDYYEILGVKKSASARIFAKPSANLRANTILTSIPETRVLRKNSRRCLKLTTS